MSDEPGRALLEAHRLQRRPEPGRADRAWRAIQDRIVAGGPEGGGGGDGGGVAAAGKGWLLGAAVGAVAVIGVGAVMFASAGSADGEGGVSSMPASPLAVAEPRAAPQDADERAEAPGAIAAPEARAASSSARPVPAPARTSRPRSAPGSEASAKPPSAAGPTAQSESDLADEVALISSAKASLASGNARAALAKTAEHERRFPRGSLVDERKLLRMRALCEDGRKGLARKEAAAFLGRKPNAAISRRVREACP